MEIVACEEAGIAVTVPKPITSNAAAHGRFDRGGNNENLRLMHLLHMSQ
jgi:hypothetical protein